MSGKEYRYGLILPNKKKELARVTPIRTVINSDDELELDDDDNDGKALNWIEASLKNSTGNSGQKSLQQKLMKEAYEHDETTFQYDEIYDDMKASQQQVEKKRQLHKKKSKYIETILKHTEKRKTENERRLERKIQREREDEGDQFADKDSFVTPSYLKKLEELKEVERNEMREKILEENADVHKHKNFGIFYNHLFKQRLGDTEIKPEPPKTVKDGNSSDRNTASSNSLLSFKRTKNNTSYRTHCDLDSDEDPPQTRHVVKKEVHSSASSESEIETNGKMDERVGYRHRRVEKNSETCSTGSLDEGIENPVKYLDSNSCRDRKGRKTSTFRDDEEHSNNRGKRGRSGQKVTSTTGVNSMLTEESRDKSMSSDNDWSCRERSRTKHSYRKERSRFANGIDQHLERSRDSYEREREHGKRKSAEDCKTEGSKYRRQQESMGNEIREFETKVCVKEKQSINSTLGLTDVNKMKVEDRIQRFIKIFAKKTVGQKLEESVQRYFERKSERDPNRLL